MKLKIFSSTRVSFGSFITLQMKKGQVRELWRKEQEERITNIIKDLDSEKKLSPVYSNSKMKEFFKHGSLVPNVATVGFNDFKLLPSEDDGDRYIEIDEINLLYGFRNVLLGQDSDDIILNIFITDNVNMLLRMEVINDLVSVNVGALEYYHLYNELLPTNDIENSLTKSFIKLLYQGALKDVRVYAFGGVEANGYDDINSQDIEHLLDVLTLSEQGVYLKVFSSGISEKDTFNTKHEMLQDLLSMINNLTKEGYVSKEVIKFIDLKLIEYNFSNDRLDIDSISRVITKNLKKAKEI